MNINQLLQAINKFAQQVSWQAGDYANYLTKKGVFKFEDVSKDIFAIMDRLQFNGKVDFVLNIEPSLQVKINTLLSGTKSAPSDNLTRKLALEVERHFSPKMSQALRQGAPKPPETITVPWLENVG